MTKAEAVSRIEMIEGMTGSRAVALVDALDALGLLALLSGAAGGVSRATQTFREVKDGISRPSTTPLTGVDTYDTLGGTTKNYG